MAERGRGKSKETKPQKKENKRTFLFHFGEKRGVSQGFLGPDRRSTREIRKQIQRDYDGANEE